MESTPKGDTPPKAVLIIDDKSSQRKVIKRLLESQGYMVTALDSPEEALYLLEYKDFPVIITDLRMPWMDGVEFCQRIRRKKPYTLIYALSGYMDAFDQRELRRAGFNGLFNKPVQIEHLQHAIAADIELVYKEI